MNNRYSDMEFEISISDLFKSILNKWKVLLIVVLIGALIGASYSFFEMRSMSAPKTDAEISALKAEMTAEDIKDVEDAAVIIKNYKEMYNLQKDYNENSIFQKLDPYAIYTLNLTYYVDNHFSVSYPIINENNDLISIIQTYASTLNNEEIYERMSSEIDSSIKPAYYSEIVTVDCDDQSDGIFVVTIYADTNEHLSAIGNVIKDELENKTEDIENMYGACDLILSSEVTQNTINTEVASDQQDNIKNLVDLSRAITDQENVFSGEKLDYLKLLVHEKQETGVPIFRNVVLVSLVFFILAVGYYLLEYLVVNTVKTSNEVENAFGVEVLGVFNKDNKTITKLINAKLLFKADQQDYKNYLFVADKKVNVKEITADFTDLSISVADDLINNFDSIDLIKKSDAAVLVIKLNSSNRKTVVDECNLCETYGIPIVGAIVLS